MNINVYKELSADLTQNASWPLFRDRRDLKTCSIAAYTITWRAIGPNGGALAETVRRDFDLLLARVAEGFARVLQILPVHLTLQPKTAMVLYRKIWRTLPKIDLPGGVECGVEQLIDCGSRVRFVGLATIPTSAIPWAVSFADQFEMVVPLLFREPLSVNDEGVLKLGQIALPPDGCKSSIDFDWAAFACHVAQRGGFCIRRTADIATNGIAIDFFGPESDMPLLIRLLENFGAPNMPTTH